MRREREPWLQAPLRKVKPYRLRAALVNRSRVRPLKRYEAAAIMAASRVEPWSIYASPLILSGVKHFFVPSH